MTYEKPEISVLGDAVDLIKGNRNGSLEQPAGDGQGAADCEFDD